MGARHRPSNVRILQFRALYKGTAKLSRRVTDSRVSATISGTVGVVKASGAVVRCTFGPQPFAAFNQR
jgi:hypothetical protein